MNISADESVEREVVERLRGDGHAVSYVAELSPSITDDQVDAVAQLFRNRATELVGAFCVIAPGSVRIRPPITP